MHTCQPSHTCAIPAIFIIELNLGSKTGSRCRDKQGELAQAVYKRVGMQETYISNMRWIFENMRWIFKIHPETPGWIFKIRPGSFRADFAQQEIHPGSP